MGIENLPPCKAVCILWGLFCVCIKILFIKLTSQDMAEDLSAFKATITGVMVQIDSNKVTKYNAH